MRFSHFSFGLIFEKISSQKRLVLHVLCQSHPCASLARTVLKPLSFLAKKMASLALSVLKPSRAIDLLPAGCESESEVKVKSESEKVMRKTFFDYPETYIYYTSCIPITKTEEKCAGQLCYGFNIQDKLEGCTHEKKIPYGDLDFWNFVYKRFRVIDR